MGARGASRRASVGSLGGTSGRFGAAAAIGRGMAPSTRGGASAIRAGGSARGASIAGSSLSLRARARVGFASPSVARTRARRAGVALSSDSRPALAALGLAALGVAAAALAALDLGSSFFGSAADLGALAMGPLFVAGVGFACAAPLGTLRRAEISSSLVRRLRFGTSCSRASSISSTRLLSFSSSVRISGASVSSSRGGGAPAITPFASPVCEWRRARDSRGSPAAGRQVRPGGWDQIRRGQRPSRPPPRAFVIA